MDKLVLVTVFSGPIWECDLLEGLLEEEGIPSFLPDHQTKIVDPFITGANPLTARIQVRQEDEARALRILEEKRPALDEGADIGLDGPGFEEEDEDDELKAETEGAQDAGEDLEYLASRTRWTALLTMAVPIILVPFLLFYGVSSVLACRSYARTSRRHALTLGAIVVGLVFAAVHAIAITWKVTL